MDELSASADLVGGSIDVTLTVVGDVALPARRIVRRRLSFPAAADDGLVVADYSDLFSAGSTLSPWSVQRWRYLVVNSVAEGGLLQAELATYTVQGAAQPSRVVVRVNRPSSVWEPSTAYAVGALVTPPTDNGFGYACATAGTSGAAPPVFPVTTNATVSDGSSVWTCVGPSTPLWTLDVIDIESVAQVHVAGGVTQIFTSASTTVPAGTVAVSAGQVTWTGATGSSSITAGFDVVELQETTCVVDPTHPNHLVFHTVVGSSVLRTVVLDQTFDANTGSWTRTLAISDAEADRRSSTNPRASGLTRGTTYYYGSFLSPKQTWQAATAYAVDTSIGATPANGYGYACTTAGTSGATAPIFPTTPDATVTDGTVVWTCLGPDPATASATATGSYGYADRLYGLLPEVHRFYDEPTPALEGTGQLRRLLQVFGAGLDQTRSLADGLLSLHDVLHVDAAYLPRLARWIGWDPDLTQPEPLQRNDILFAPAIFASVGTIPTTAALVNRMSGWPCQIKEMLDNVFLTNGVEAVRLWQIYEATSTTAGSGFSAPAPQGAVYPIASEPAVTQQDPNAFDARPAAVVDAGGTLWLFWHSHRLGSEWQAATAYAVGSILAPSAAAGRQYVCVTAGTSGANEPAFPQMTNAQVSDGTALWKCTGVGSARRRIWLQRLGTDPTPIDVVADLEDDPSFFDEAPAALFDETRVWVFWSSNRRGTIDIWARSVTAGTPPAFGAAAQVTEEGVGDRNPAAVRDAAGNLRVFWESSRRGPTDIWSATSGDDGSSWSAAARLTTGNLRDRTPAAIVDTSGAVRLFYSQETGDGCKIRQGVLSGTTWSFSDVTTSIPSFRDEAPAAVVWASAVWVFWHSNRFGSIWQAGTAYAVGAIVLPAASNGAYYRCTTAGTSGTTAPTFLTAPGSTANDGGVVWTCVGRLANAGMLGRFRLWMASAPAAASTSFGAPAAVLSRLSNDQQPAAVVDHAGELHLYFASQESGERFRSRTVDTSTAPATGRTPIANKLALGSMGTYLDRLHYTYDTRNTTSAAAASAARPVGHARDTVGVYLEPGPGAADAQNLQTTARVRALVAQFQPIQVKLVWYVKQSTGAFAAPYADAVQASATTSARTQGPGT